MMPGRKTCMWFGELGEVVHAVNVPQSFPTPSREQSPVFIVAFDEQGKFQQADIYFYDHRVVSVGPNGTALYMDGNGGVLEW